MTMHAAGGMERSGMLSGTFGMVQEIHVGSVLWKILMALCGLPLRCQSE